MPDNPPNQDPKTGLPGEGPTPPPKAVKRGSPKDPNPPNQGPKTGGAMTGAGPAA